MIIVNRLTKFYGKVKALDHVSLELKTPDPLVILGPSGSGKTTLLRLIAGLEIPDEGEVHINGSLASKPGWAILPHQRHIGFVFQSSALWPHMTVTQNIFFGLDGLTKNEAKERLRKLIELTHLKGLEHRYPDELSGGEARRVAIARCLAPEPKYLLMDEPLINLDPELKGKMLTLIEETARRTEAFLIYVTHDTEEAKKISGQMFFLKSGRLVM
jgi:iron(III) transport system ATP-binding protein